MVARVDKQTATKKQQDIFSDFLNGFVNNPFTGALSRVTNENSVKQALRNLILTSPGERVYQPILGGGIRKFLFEQMSEFTAHDIREQIKRTIANFDERIVDYNVIVNPNYIHNSYDVTIFFSIVNSSDVQQLDLILKRLR